MTISQDFVDHGAKNHRTVPHQVFAENVAAVQAIPQRAWQIAQEIYTASFHNEHCAMRCTQSLKTFLLQKSVATAIHYSTWCVPQAETQQTSWNQTQMQ